MARLYFDWYFERLKQLFARTILVIGADGSDARGVMEAMIAGNASRRGIAGSNHAALRVIASRRG